MKKISMTKSYDAVALTLFSWFKYKKRNYGIIKRSWLQEQVLKSQGVEIKMRTLDRALARMRHLGLLYSETRHRKDTKTGAFVPEVSILYFTDELRSYVSKLFKFFKRLFGLSDLTEYTLSDILKHEAIYDFIVYIVLIYCYINYAVIF
jgi:hypothetical protein